MNPILWPLLAAFFFGFGIVIVSNFIRYVSPVVLMAFNSVGLVLFLTFVFSVGHERLGFGKPLLPHGKDQWIAACIMVIVIILAQFCYYKSFAVVPQFVISVAMISMPFFVFIAGWLLAKLFGLEIPLPTPKECIAVLIISLGIALLVTPEEKIPFLS